ncbi:MAG: cbb3-type cytochrome c oxidase subunit 3 [Betaproteobacteria bacterium]|nr:cbb3-type cytochrome c oxidase subunit 3 [Betaproteobacteria bacterium]
MNDLLALFGSITTVMAFAAFVGIAWMAYAPRFAARHQRDAMIPFLDSQMPAAASERGDESASNS